MLPGDAAAAVDEYLGAVDVAVPGFVESLYVVGSIALDDYREGISDVDLVAVCAATPARVHLDALREVHRPSKPSVDVLYLSPGDPSRDPTALSPPSSVAGEVHPTDGFEANPSVWRVLATCAIPVRGSPLAPDHVWFDGEVLRRWNLGNLDQYWEERIEEWQRIEPVEARLRHEYGVQWLVLGVPRLHYTIATLDVTSKSGAGRYARSIVDERFHPVLDAAVALRADRDALLYAAAATIRDDAVALARWLIDDAHRLMPA